MSRQKQPITIIKEFVFSRARYFCYQSGNSFICLRNNKHITHEEFKHAYKCYKQS